MLALHRARAASHRVASHGLATYCEPAFSPTASSGTCRLTTSEVLDILDEPIDQDSDDSLDLDLDSM